MDIREVGCNEVVKVNFLMLNKASRYADICVSRLIAPLIPDLDARWRL
jgi:hypothetical protein